MLVPGPARGFRHLCHLLVGAGEMVRGHRGYRPLVHHRHRRLLDDHEVRPEVVAPVEGVPERARSREGARDFVEPKLPRRDDKRQEPVAHRAVVDQRELGSVQGQLHHLFHASVRGELRHLEPHGGGFAQAPRVEPPVSRVFLGVRAEAHREVRPEDALPHGFQRQRVHLDRRASLAEHQEPPRVKQRRRVRGVGREVEEVGEDGSGLGPRALHGDARVVAGSLLLREPRVRTILHAACAVFDDPSSSAPKIMPSPSNQCAYRSLPTRMRPGPTR